MQVALLLLAGIFLSLDINRQLVDYDEATYAKVVVDTLDSGNVLTFQLNGNNWFEKPPLYLWLAMGGVLLFGEQEYAFRIPSILASILCCWLVYLIVRKLTRDQIAATAGFLILLFSNAFFVYAREVRLDSAVVAALLATLFFFIKSWENEKYLLWIFPLIAIGFLFKSVIILLVVPVIFFYSIFYRKWWYLKNKYLWFGGLPALAIIVPWHLYETVQFGHAFWRDYLGTQVFHRATATLTGSNGIGDYFILFIPWYLPWNAVLLISLALLIVFSRLKQFAGRVSLREIAAPLIVAIFIFSAFTLARTHLGSYVMPAFPFFAMCIAISWHQLSSCLPRFKITLASIMSVLLIAGSVFCIYLMPGKVPEYTLDERAIGRAYKAQNINNAPLYALGWLATETLNYYGNTRTQHIDPAVVRGTILHGPFYLLVDPPSASYFFYSRVWPIAPSLKLVYEGRYFILIYSDRDLQMPMFQYVQRP